MQTHYLRASSSHLHLDLRRMAIAAPFWERLRREVGPVLGARLSACGVELVVQGGAASQVRERVERALRAASLASLFPTGAWSFPERSSWVVDPRAVPGLVVELAQRAQEDAHAQGLFEPLWSTFRETVGASASPWLDMGALSRAAGVSRLELPVWATCQDGEAEAGERRRLRHAPLRSRGVYDTLSVLQALCAAYRCGPRTLMNSEEAAGVAVATAERVSLDPATFAARLEVSRERVEALWSAVQRGALRPRHEAMEAVRICLGDPRLRRQVPIFRLIGPRWCRRVAETSSQATLAPSLDARCSSLSRERCVQSS